MMDADSPIAGSIERQAAGEHLVEQDSHRVYVAALVYPSLEKFRSHVLRRSHDAALLCWLFTEPGDDTEVVEIEVVVLVKQDVGGFDIAMEQAQRMHVGQGACKLFKHNIGFVQGEHASREHVFECSTLHKGHNQVMIPSKVTSIQTWHDMLVLQGLHDLSLAIQHTQVGGIAVDDFDGDVCPGIDMVSQVDGGHAALL